MVYLSFANNWEIPISNVPNYDSVLPNNIFENQTKDFAILLYNQAEVRMSLEVGKILLLKKTRKEKNISVLNEIKEMTCLVNTESTRDSIKWLTKKSFYFHVYFFDKTINKSQGAIVFVDLQQKKFTCIRSKSGTPVDINNVDEKNKILSLFEWKWQRKEKNKIKSQVVSYDVLSWFSFPLTAQKAQKTIENKSFLV